MLFTALFAVVVMGGLEGCRTVSYAEMSPTGRIARLLPPLEARIDIPSLEGVFGATIVSGSLSDFGYYESVSYANPLVQDMITLYDRDMRNIAEEYGPACGLAVCRLVDGKVSGGGFGWAYLSGLTLFIPNLLGVPIAYAKASMQLEMSIFTTRGALVGMYTSEYNRERVPVALYYGYGSDASLKVAIDAFKACMTDIKGQIEADFNRLNGALVPAAAPLYIPEAGREPVLRESW